MNRMLKRTLMYGGGIIAFLLLIYKVQMPCQNSEDKPKMVARENAVYDNEKAYIYDRNMALIFIGGMPRSGTTLARAMLDAHPDIRCGEETRVIPRLLGLRSQWLKSPKESKRLEEAGLTSDVIDSALAAFILEIIAKHGEAAPRLCNKDPFTLKSAVYLSSLFPNAKFILMIRDGRAVVHSIISRKVTITGFDLTNFRQCLTRWNQAMQTMHYQCQELGSNKCLPVYYEQLVLHPEHWMRRTLKFLEIPWNNSVLHHEQHIGKPGGISLSKVERSTDQVIKPINLEALSKWVGQIPDDVVQDMSRVAPMLATLGYDPYANPPNYGQPDSAVAKNTKLVHDNKDYWEKKAQELVQGVPDMFVQSQSHNPNIKQEETHENPLPQQHPPLPQEIP